jgi:hypothetical protein
MSHGLNYYLEPNIPLHFRVSDGHPRGRVKTRTHLVRFEYLNPQTRGAKSRPAPAGSETHRFWVQTRPSAISS